MGTHSDTNRAIGLTLADSNHNTRATNHKEHAPRPLCDHSEGSRANAFSITSLANACSNTPLVDTCSNTPLVDACSNTPLVSACSNTSLVNAGTDIPLSNTSSDASPAIAHPMVRNDWARDEVECIYQTPLLELVFRAATVHRQFHNPNAVQQCTLLSIKTGGCPEDCAYCPQSARYNTSVSSEPLMDVQDVIASATRAKEAGSTRFCMGAAWRSPKDNEQFQQVLEMVRGVSSLGLEVCCTLGMLSENQAVQLKEAGLTAYNHNLDTGKNFYDKIITSRTYEDRLTTLKHVKNAGISVCCGGIVGMGETHADRIDLLHTLATLEEHPESVPVNGLVSVAGTPLENQSMVPVLDMVRMIAAARVLMPASMVRLSAGRINLTVAEQTLCFFAGANSIFTGEKLLTTPNNECSEDAEMFAELGLEPFVPGSVSTQAHSNP